MHWGCCCLPGLSPDAGSISPSKDPPVEPPGCSKAGTETRHSADFWEITLSEGGRMKGRGRGSTQRGCRLTQSFPGSRWGWKAPERQAGEQAVSPRGFLGFDLDVRDVPFGQQAKARVMGPSGIRDKSLIASCRSLFTKAWEDKKLLGKEWGGGGSSPERGRRSRGGDFPCPVRWELCAGCDVALSWGYLGILGERSLLNHYFASGIDLWGFFPPPRYE